MKIAQVCFKYPPVYSGYGKQLKSINDNLLKEQDVCINVLTTYQDKFINSTLSSNLNIVSIYKYDSRKNKIFITTIMFFIKTFYWLIKNRKNYEIIHSIGAEYISAVPSVIVGKIFRKKVIIKITQAEYRTVHRNLLKKSLQNFRKKIINYADVFIAISQEIKEELIKNKINPDKIYKIPNGVDLDYYSCGRLDSNKLSRQKLNIPLNSNVLLFVGALNQRKGFYDLLKALELIKDIQLDVYFCGLISTEFKYPIDTINIKYHFLGLVNNTREYLCSADIFVFPSHSEGLPNALLEAVAAQVPCIVSNIGGNNDIIQNKVNGLFFEKGNHIELSEKIMYLIKDDDLKNSIKENLLNRVEEYDLNKVAKSYYNLYKHLYKQYSKGI